MASNTRASLSAVLSMNNTKFKKGLTGAKTQMKGFTRSINAIGKSLVPFIGITAGVTALTGVMRGAFRTITGFEQAMADVKAVTRATEEDFNKLKQAARELGASTKFTAIEVAGLSKELGKLGFSTEEILAAEASILDLAAATNTELARAAEVVGITIRQFGLAASESGRVVDLMAGSFSRSALDTEKFAEAMKMVGPVAMKAGVSLEQTTALLSKLADAGISGTMAGTGLRKIISELSGEGEDLSERFRELAERGLNLADAEDEVGLRAKTALLVILDQIDMIPKLTEEYENLGGAAKEMADVQLNTLTGQLTILQSAYDGLIQTAGGTEEGMRKAKKAVGGAAAGIQLMTGIVDDGTTKWQRYAFQAAPVITSFVMLKKEANETVRAMETYFKSTQEAARETAALIWEQKVAAQEAERLAEEEERLAEALREAAHWEKFWKDVLKDKNAEMLYSTDLTKDYNKAIKDLTKDMRPLLDVWTELGDNAEMLDDEEFLPDDTGMKLARENFKGLAKDGKAMSDTLVVAFGNVGSQFAESLGTLIGTTDNVKQELDKLGAIVFKALGDIMIMAGVKMGFTPAGIGLILGGLLVKGIGAFGQAQAGGSGGGGSPFAAKDTSGNTYHLQGNTLYGNDIRNSNNYYTDLYNRVG